MKCLAIDIEVVAGVCHRLAQKRVFGGHPLRAHFYDCWLDDTLTIVNSQVTVAGDFQMHLAFRHATELRRHWCVRICEVGKIREPSGSANVCSAGVMAWRN